MVYMTLDCIGLTQYIVIRIIHSTVSLKCFFHSLKCLLLSLVFSYIYILQGLWCGGMYNNHIIANCPQSVPVNKC